MLTRRHHAQLCKSQPQEIWLRIVFSFAQCLSALCQAPHDAQLGRDYAEVADPRMRNLGQRWEIHSFLRRGCATHAEVHQRLTECACRCIAGSIATASRPAASIEHRHRHVAAKKRTFCATLDRTIKKEDRGATRPSET